MTEAEQLVKKKRNRSGPRAFATKYLKESEGLPTQYDTANAADKKRIAEELLTNQELLCARLETLQLIDSEIEGLIEEEEAAVKDMMEAGESNRLISRILVRIKNSPIFATATPPATLSPASLNTSTRAQSHAKLPKLNLREFDGDPLQFQEFWDIFTSSVHNNDTLDDVAKFSHLKGLLVGKAKLVIQSLTLTSENYTEAVALLKKRFGDEQVIIQAHMDALLALNPVCDFDVIALRTLCDKIEIHIRNLQLYDISSQNYGPVLISIIQSKIPGDVKLEISRKMPDGKWEIDKLLDVLQKEVTARERCASTSNGATGSFDGSAAALLTTGGRDNDQQRQNRSTKKNQCLFCDKKGHPSKTCRKVPSAEERKVILYRKNRCYVCFSPTHKARDCNIGKICQTCGGKHHAMICEGCNNREDNANEGNNETVAPGNGNNTNERNVANNCCAINAVSSKCVLLQTARADAMNTVSERTVSIRLIFDNCAQRSFIKAEIVEKLNLQCIGKEKLGVNTFASQKTNSEDLNVVEVAIRSVHDPTSVVVIQANVVLFICSPITNQIINVVKKRYGILRDVLLADNSSNSSDMEIDLLIRANYCGEFAMG